MYGSEILVNGGMEAPYSSGGVANGWSSVIAPSQETSIVHSGSSSQKMVSMGQYLSTNQSVGITDNVQYKTSGWLYVTSGRAVIAIQEYNGAWANYGQVANSLTGAWQYLKFYSQRDYTNPTLRIYDNNVPTTWYIDDVSLKQVLVRYPVANTNWHHVVVTTDTAVNTSDLKIGKGGGSGYMSGNIDEVKISSTARSAGWIATEYANQNSPATFYFTDDTAGGASNNIVWTNGSGDNKWSTAGNWQGGVVPTSSDIATFNSSASGNITIDGNVGVKGIDIASGYTGTISLGSNTLTVSGNWTNAVGGISFEAGTGAVNFTGIDNTISGTTSFYILGGEGSIFSIPSTVTVGTNNTTITTNNGTITTNNGAITTNNGTVGTNSSAGIISNNLGSIAINNGTTDTVTFSDGQYNGATGVITGDAIFNYTGFTATDGSIIDITGYANGTVGGVSKDSLGATITTWIFNNTNNLGKVTGDAIFNNSTNNTGTVDGNVAFNNSATNSGIIIHNADIYSPVPRPIGGTIYGSKTYHGYDGMYFNDTAAGAGNDGNWGNALNWWYNSIFTNPAGDIPYSDDDVTIYGNLSTTTASTSVARNITFESNSTNGISITAVVSAMFNSVSSNLLAGSIIGNTTFVGNYTNNLGNITGTLIRQFNISTSTERKFSGSEAEGGRGDWIIIAQGAVVNISNAIYDMATNIFKGLNDGSFVENTSINGGASVIPEIIVDSPTVGVNIKWEPSVDWGNSTLCQYSYNNWATTNTATCASNGVDITRPATTSNILSLRGTDMLGNITEKNVAFTYDNISPVWTTCGADLLDEPTREYYYLKDGAVTGDCHIRTNVELHGSLSGTAPSAGTLTGQVISDATSTNGFNITLKYITVTGTTTSASAGSGKDGGSITVLTATTNTLVSNGTAGTNGGSGGDIIVATSTTGEIFANGADGTANGGTGGDITIYNSDGNATSITVTSNGGSSTDCGDGGNTGAITITNSDRYTAVATAGLGSNRTCSSGGHTSGSMISPPIVIPRPIIIPPSTSASNSTNQRGSSGGTYVRTTDYDSFLNIDRLNRLNLSNLPKVSFDSMGNAIGNLGVSSLINPLSNLLKISPVTGFLPSLPKINFVTKMNNFISSLNTLPKSLATISEAIPSIRKELNKAGIINGYNLYSMEESPIHTPTLKELKKDNIAQPNNLLFVSLDGREAQTKLSIDEKGNVYQIIDVEPETYVYVSVKNTSKNIKAEFEGNGVAILKDKNNIVKVVVPSPAEVGNYTLKVGNLLLEVRVKKVVVPEKEPVKLSETIPEAKVEKVGKTRWFSPIVNLWSRVVR